MRAVFSTTPRLVVHIYSTMRGVVSLCTVTTARLVKNYQNSGNGTYEFLLFFLVF